MDDEYEPIEPLPRAKPDSAVAALLEEVLEMSIALRLGSALVMSVAAWPLLSGAVRVGGLDHWLGWAVALGILEPLGLTCLAAAVFFLLPGVGIGRLLAWASRRARLALLVTFLVWVGGIVVGLYLAAWQVLTLP